MALDATQKEKLAALLAQEQVAVLVTQGEPWPTANLQAFAETPELDLLFIMGANVDKYQNLLKHAEATVLVDNRDVGKRADLRNRPGVDAGACQRRGAWERRVGIAQGDLPQEESVRGAVFQKRRPQDDSHQAYPGFLRERPARHF